MRENMRENMSENKCAEHVYFRGGGLSVGMSERVNRGGRCRLLSFA